jgi:hypothetical protein
MAKRRKAAKRRPKMLDIRVLLPRVKGSVRLYRVIGIGEDQRLYELQVATMSAPAQR